MAISRANIGKEIKMSGNKKVTKYKKGRKIKRSKAIADRATSLPVTVLDRKGKYKPGKTGTMEAKNWLLGSTQEVWGDDKVDKDLIATDSHRLHNKILKLKKKKKVQKKKEGGMILDAKFVASFYN